MDRTKKLVTVRFRNGEEGQECCLDPLGHNRFRGRKGWTPSTDIVETEDTVVILMDLAGLDKEAIKIVRKGDLLQISGVRTRKTGPRDEAVSPDGDRLRAFREALPGASGP